MVPRPLRDLGVESDTLGQGMFRGKVASKRLGYTHRPIRGTKEVKCDAMRYNAPLGSGCSAAAGPGP